MKRMFLILAILSISMPFVHANDKTELEHATHKKTDANVYGHIVDSKTKEHIPYANILLKGTTITTLTDATGHYFLKNLPEGSYQMEVRFTGYRTSLHDIDVKKDSTIELNISLDPDAVLLDETVVSANRGESKRREAPVLVNIVTAKAFEATQSCNLAEGLNFQPGVRVENDCQNCGFNQVRINGLDGHYSQILIDSRPIFSALAGVYGLEQIPANMIDRVEVMRGGGSALFGSSAIGGTINVITKEPLRNSGEVSHSLLAIGGSSSFENNTSLNASLVTDNNRAGLFLYGQNRNRQSYDADGDGYTELPELRNQVLGLRSFLKTGLYSKLSLQYNHISDFRRGGNRLDLPAHEANITEQTSHDIHNGGVNFDYFTKSSNKLNAYFSFQNVDRDSYYGGIADGSPDNVELARKAYGHTTDLTWVVGTQYKHGFKKAFFLPADLTVGAEYNYDHLKDVSLGYNQTTDQTVHIGSAFLQNEWKNEQWGLLVGGRFDKHNLIDHLIFSPRVNMRYNPTEKVNFRVSYSSGFRAPQTFDEDLHVTIAGGNRLTHRLADGLKEERSHSFSASTDLYHNFGNVRTNLLIEGFYTLLDDAFATRYLSEPDENGNIVIERYNGSGARVFGLNVEGKAAIGSFLDLQAGVTLQQSHYTKPEHWSDDAPDEKKIFRTPNTYGYFVATVNPLKELSVALSGTYTGEMLVQHAAGSGTPVDVAVRTPDFFTMNVKIGYKFPILDILTMEASAGVQNIFNAYQKDFDKGWNRDSGYIYGPSTPRSYFASLKLNF